MVQTSSCSLAWIRTGIAAGMASCLAYPSLVFLHLPRAALVLVAAALGPLLGVATYGLGRLLQISRPSVSAQLAVAFNFAGGALVTAMLLIQLAVKTRASGNPLSPELVGIWLGLDVAWDVYIGIGTGLLALSMLRHPRFGVLFGSAGITIAVLLIVLNIYTFPTPPGDAGLIDIGPVVGLWYLAVTIQAWRSLGWAKSIVFG
jgi:hypothetical protein